MPPDVVELWRNEKIKELEKKVSEFEKVDEWGDKVWEKMVSKLEEFSKKHFSETVKDKSKLESLQEKMQKLVEVQQEYHNATLSQEAAEKISQDRELKEIDDIWNDTDRKGEKFCNRFNDEQTQS